MPEKAAMDRRRMSGELFLFFLYLLCMLSVDIQTIQQQKKGNGD